MAEFRTEGTAFPFLLLVGFALLIFAALLSLPFVLPMIRGGTFLHMHDVYLISTIARGIRDDCSRSRMVVDPSFMVPVMYVQRCRASEALSPLPISCSASGEILLYCLFLIVLALATGIVTCLVPARLLHRRDFLTSAL